MADGLPKASPQSSLKLIGCQMNPPMLDVSGSDFSSALASVGDGREEIWMASSDRLERGDEQSWRVSKTSCLNKAIGNKVDAGPDGRRSRSPAATASTGQQFWQQQERHGRASAPPIGNGIDGVGWARLGRRLERERCVGRLDAGMSRLTQLQAGVMMVSLGTEWRRAQPFRLQASPYRCRPIPRRLSGYTWVRRGARRARVCKCDPFEARGQTASPSCASIVSLERKRRRSPMIGS